MSGNNYEPIGKRKNSRTPRGAKSKQQEKKNKGRPNKKQRRWLWFLLKLMLIVAILVAAYGVYLNAKIRNRIDGQVWQLPAAVYGRVINLEPGMPYGKKEVIALLEGSQYRQVDRTTRPGDFSIQGEAIELIRRPFDFPDSAEGRIRVNLSFVNNTLDSIKNLDNGRDFGVFRLDPRLITMMQSPNGEQRLFIPRTGFPHLLINTLVATEDRHFYHHDGISFYSIGRALIANLLAGRTVQGGSTLTQQLVKNLFLTNERSLWRKLNEAYMALIMDASYTKDRILELYLNEVYLGQAGNDEIRGFPLASLYYFGRPVDELSLDQQALLVGLVKGASLYNPWRNPKRALERRNLVLNLLLQQQIIDQELYDTFSVRPLGVQPKGGNITPQPAFMQMVRTELQEKLGDTIQSLSGAKIFTTLDPVAQTAAEKAVEEGIPDLKKRYRLNDLETAMVVVDRFTGEIRSLVGGADPQFAGYNRALLARRSIGSLAKPATYLTALERPSYYRLNTWLADEPLSLKLPDGQVWEPHNNNQRFSGKAMLVDALANSINIPTVNLGLALGVENVAKTWERLGVPASQLSTMPSILLGALNLTPIEAAQAFQSIASGGNKARLSALRSVVNGSGVVMYQSFPQSVAVTSPQASFLTLYGMQQVVKRGTARALRQDFPNIHLAGKTGTTNSQIDSWFAGIDGKEVTITWVGRDNNQPSKLYGASGAMQIYRRYLKNQTPTPLLLTPPEEIIPMKINQEGDFICGDASGNDPDTLPVWTTNPDVLCQQTLSQQPALLGIGRDLQQEKRAEKKDSESVADWIKEMFGDR